MGRRGGGGGGRVAEVGRSTEYGSNSGGRGFPALTAIEARGFWADFYICVRIGMATVRDAKFGTTAIVLRVFVNNNNTYKQGIDRGET